MIIRARSKHGGWQPTREALCCGKPRQRVNARRTHEQCGKCQQLRPPNTRMWQCHTCGSRLCPECRNGQPHRRCADRNEDSPARDPEPSADAKGDPASPSEAVVRPDTPPRAGFDDVATPGWTSQARKVLSAKATTPRPSHSFRLHGDLQARSSGLAARVMQCATEALHAATVCPAGGDSAALQAEPYTSAKTPLCFTLGVCRNVKGF